MAEFGLSESAVRAGIHRLMQKGLVTVKREGPISHYMLSAAGLRRLKEGTRRVYHREPHHWDGWWRLVVYQIPESERGVRDQLRRELVWNGLGLLAQSTWITPNPLEPVLQDLVDEYVTGHGHVDVFRSQFLGEPVDLVGRCWDLEAVTAAYRAFLHQWHSWRERPMPVQPSEAFVARVRLVHEYRKFLNIDPDLPVELLPEKWIGYRAAELFQTLHEALTPAADEFFEENFQP